MKIKDIPRIDRPREKLIKYGPSRLSNAELLAVILGSGRKGENVIQLSKKILKKITDKNFSSLNLDDLNNIAGLGIVKSCQIIAAIEWGKRILKNKQSVLFMTPKDVWKQMGEWRNSKKEHFIIFYLDVRNQVINREIVSIGTLNSSLVHPREVFEPAVRYVAGQIILSHNHPSGETNPSSEDIGITERLVKAGKILGIEVIDHIIVSKDSFFSFKEKKLI